MDYVSNNSKIIACDIGASNCDPTPHIDNLLKNTESKLYGFEPNKIEFEKLISENKDKKREFFNYAIGNGEEKIFNICEYPGWSSFLEADIDNVKNFHRFELDAVIKDKKYRGGLVVEPKEGIHFKVVVMDFASLYPSIIKVRNLSYETVR